MPPQTADYSHLNTPITPAEEPAFQLWKQKNAPKDSGFDYDLAGAFKAGVVRDPKTGHMPDTFKKPNHPTFSNQSKFYAIAPEKAGRWEGDRFIPPAPASDMAQRFGVTPDDDMARRFGVGGPPPAPKGPEKGPARPTTFRDIPLTFMGSRFTVGDVLGRAKQVLPSPRTATGMAGAALGGAATLPAYVTGPGGLAGTALGAGAGYTGGTHLYDILTGTRPEKEDITGEMVTGALQEVGGPQMAKGLGMRLEQGVPKAIERAIKPKGGKEILAIQEAAPIIAEDFSMGLTRSQLRSQALENVNRYSQQLEQAWNRIPYTRKLPTAPARLALMKERAGLFNERGQLIPNNENKYRELTHLIDYFVQNPYLSPGDIRNHRAIWDAMINWPKQLMEGRTLLPITEPDRVYASEVAANALRDTINTSLPEVARLNSKVSAWINTAKVLGARTLADEQAGQPYFYRLVPEAGGAGGGALLAKTLGLSAETGAVAGGGVMLADQIRRSTAFQSASVPARREISRLLNAGMTQRAVGVLLSQLPRDQRGDFLKSLLTRGHRQAEAQRQGPGRRP